MSSSLFVLVILQGANGLTFSPGYTTAAECVQHSHTLVAFNMTRRASPGRLFSKPLPVALGRFGGFQMKAPARITSVP